MKGLLFVSLVAAMLLFGCLGAPAQPNAGNANPPSGGIGGLGMPSTGGSGPSTGGPATSGNAMDDFARLIGLKSSLTFRADYDITSSGAGGTDTFQMTQYLKGSDKLRMDSEYGGTESRVYLMDKAYYSCTNDNGWTCMKISAPPSQTGDEAEKILENRQKYQVIADGTKQVAGVTATCFKVTGENIIELRSCHSPEGVPLYSKSKTQGPTGIVLETEMTARSYTTQVSDSDFALPAQPTDISSMYGGGSGNNIGNGGNGGMDCSICDEVPEEYRDACLANC